MIQFIHCKKTVRAIIHLHWFYSWQIFNINIMTRAHTWHSFVVVFVRLLFLNTLSIHFWKTAFTYRLGNPPTPWLSPFFVEVSWNIYDIHSVTSNLHWELMCLSRPNAPALPFIVCHYTLVDWIQTNFGSICLFVFLIFFFQHVFYQHRISLKLKFQYILVKVKVNKTQVYL